MADYNEQGGRLTLKLVYYGPALGATPHEACA